jgi:hypothetical protein
MSSIRAIVTASDIETRILVQDSTGDLLIARLGSIEHAHRYALRMLLEALALWDQQLLDVVLFADEQSDWERAGLLDVLGVARDLALLRVHLVPVEIHRTHRTHRVKQLTGLGSFARERNRLRSVVV